jgi:carboxymethylenebutenolidase
MNGHANGPTGEQAVTLPSAQSIKVTEDITIQPPLTRRGHGPGLLLLVPADVNLSGSDKTLDPPPLQKWAEEGYAVAQVGVDGNNDSKCTSKLEMAIDELRKVQECDSVDKIGLIGK